MTVLRSHNIPSVWLPARRDQPFGPLVTKLPGRRWGTRFQNVASNSLVKISKSWSLHNNCATLNIDELVVETKNCSTKLPTVWAKSIPTQQELLQVSCPKEYYAAKCDIGKSNRCFKIYNNLTYPVTWIKASEVCRMKRNGNLMKISSAYDTSVFLKMAKKSELRFGSKCWMGLKRKDGTMNGFVWSSGLEEVTFVNWNSEHAKDQSAMKFGTRGVVHGDGTWSLLPDYSTLKCFVCEAAADLIGSELSVKFFPLSNKLRLRVYFPHGLWRDSTEDKGFECFTDSAGNLIRSVKTTQIWDRTWTVEDIELINRIRRNGGKFNLSFHVHKKMYELEYDKQSSGHYWCEGHKIPNFEHIKSNTVLVIGQASGRIYSLILDIHGNCEDGKDMKSCDPTFSNILEQTALNLMDKISSLKVASLRAMRIINVFNNGTLRILFHIQSPQSNKTFLHDYGQIMGIVTQTVERYRHVYTFQSLHSTENCPPHVTYEDSRLLNWNITPLGSTSVSTELCLDEDGMPVRRKCLGNFIDGAEWNQPSGKCVNKDISNITLSLHKLALSSASQEACEHDSLAEKVASLVSNPLLLTTADIYFVSKIMKDLAKVNWKDSIPSLTTIIQILNNVHRAKRQSVKLSQTRFNSTNVLLDSLQRLIEQITVGSKYKDDGVLLAVTSQVIVQISDPILSNVTGLVLLRNKSISNVFTMSTERYKSFEEFEIKPVKINDRNSEFLQNLNEVEIAVWVPENVVMEYAKGDGNNSWYDYPNDLQGCSSSLFTLPGNRPKIVIVVFYDDLIFQNISQSEHAECPEHIHSSVVASRVVSVSIPGYSPDLPVPIPIFFRRLVNISVHGATNRQCAFWDFTYNSSTPSSSLGGWSAEGCVYAGNSTFKNSRFGNISSLLSVLDVCVCTHLTHFSELITRSQHIPTTMYGFTETGFNHKTALDIISLFGCSLSVLGVLGIAVTAIIFRSWRQKPGTKILLQLSLALGMQMAIFILSSFDIVRPGYEEHAEENIEIPSGTEVFNIGDFTYEVVGKAKDTADPPCPAFAPTVTCTIIGALLHYFVLSAFTWMLITAVMQFLRYVKVLGATRPPRFLLKAMVFGWGVPVVPVALVVTLTPSSYLPPSPESTILCYPSGLPLYLGILLPTGLIVATNFIIYVMIICSIMKIPHRKARKEGSSSLVLQQIRLSVVLFFLLGLSWLFGIMAALGAGIVFSYLFCVSATIQGFMLFLFFVVCDPSTRYLWTKMLGLWKNMSVTASNGATDFLSSTTTSSLTAPQKPNSPRLTS